MNLAKRQAKEKMAERELIVDKERIDYEGPFEMVDFYRLFEAFAIDMAYDRKELKHAESVTKEGKFIELELEPWKTLTDYAKSFIHVRVQMANVKDIVVDGKRLQTGKISVVIDGILETDYESRWEGKPVLLFLRSFYDKYIYKPLAGGFDKMIRSDTMHLKEVVKAFLNMYQFR